MESEAEKSHWVKDIIKRVDISEESLWEDIKRYLYSLKINPNHKINVPQKTVESISRLERIVDEIYAHILKDNSFVDLVVDNISNLDVKYAINQQIQDGIIIILQEIGEYDNIKKKFIYTDNKIILDNFNTTQKKRLNEILFEAERDSKEFSEKTLMSSLVFYKKLIIQNEIHNLRKSIENSKNKEDTVILLNKAKDTMKVLCEIEI